MICTMANASTLDSSSPKCLVYRYEHDGTYESWIRDRIELFALLGNFTFIFHLTLLVCVILQISFFIFLHKCLGMEISDDDDDDDDEEAMRRRRRRHVREREKMMSQTPPEVCHRNEKKVVSQSTPEASRHIEKLMEEHAEALKRSKVYLERLLDPRLGTPSEKYKEDGRDFSQHQ